MPLFPIPRFMSWMLTNKSLLGFWWPYFEGSMAVFACGLTCWNWTKNLNISPGTFSSMSSSIPSVKWESLATEKTFSTHSVKSPEEKKSNKSKLRKHLVPVNTVSTKIISTFVASIPIFASIQHISPHLGTTLIQIIYWHSIYWKNVINSPALYHSRWNSAYWCLKSII